MQSDLNTKYGFCELPVGIKLYRSYSEPNSIDQLFFTTSYNNALIWGDNIQIWTAKKKIKILFLLRHINSKGIGESSLPDLYYEVYPNESNKSLDDLDIKQDINRRNPFTQHLFKNNIYGWFTTIEDRRTDFEICLFNKNWMLDYFECKEVPKDDGEIYYQESLKEIIFFPPESFFKNSREIINSDSQINERGKDLFKLHSERIKSLVNSYVKEGQALNVCEHRYYDIRLKLGI